MNITVTAYPSHITRPSRATRLALRDISTHIFDQVRTYELPGFVGRDGWTSNETYDKALRIFGDLREGLKSLMGKSRATFEAQTRLAGRESLTRPIN